jgi:glycosyltransferase 2 family protein
MDSLAKITPKKVIIALSILVFCVFIIKQHSDFSNSISAIKAANIHLIGLSLVFSFFSFIAAAAVFVFISIKKLPYFRTLLVQVASAFTNRLLPAGTGGLATFTRYLMTQGHTTSQAAALSSVNNLLGFLGLMLITIAVALTSHTPLDQVIRLTLPSWVYLFFFIFLIATLLFAALNKRAKKVILKTLLTIKKDLITISARPLRLLMALIASMMITLSFAAVLYVSVYALGTSITILQTFIVLTVGVAAASVTPTPGGIGGAEAGLVAALSSIGINADVGLSIALVYRMATFWLPIVPGFIAFQIALKKNLL